MCAVIHTVLAVCVFLIFRSFEFSRLSVFLHIRTAYMRPLTFLSVSSASIALAVSGCSDSAAVSYRIPKEREAERPAQPHSPHARAGVAGEGMAARAVDSASGRELSWSAPAQWKPKPGSAVRKGSYAIGDEASAVADLAITAFPGDVGGDLANVNRWRGQLQMPAISAAELPAMLTHLDHNGLHMNVVELVSGEGAAAMRMLSAIVPFEGATWFFKLTGPAELVAREKAGFLEFLATVRPASEPASGDPHAGVDLPPASMPPASSGTMADTPVTTAQGPVLKWSTPAHWEPKPGSPTRKGSFLVKGEGDDVADLAITAFPGDVGGELANLNRWRNQLQLEPLAASDVERVVTRRQVHGLNLTIIDLAGAGGAQGQRMIGAIVPFGGATWFFKLAGSDTLVAREKPAFLSFLETLQRP